MAICSGLKAGEAFVSADGYLLCDVNGQPLSLLAIPDRRKVIINNVVYRIRVNFNLKESE